MSNGAQVPTARAVFGHMDGMGSVARTALSGIRTGLRELDRAAQGVSGPPGQRPDSTHLAEPLIRALEQRRAIEASVEVLRHADRVLDALFHAFR